MADLDKVKRNVQKMVSMNAPESDIDQYISGEGVTIDQVKAHKVGTQQSSQQKNKSGNQPQSYLQSRFPEVYNPLVDLKYNAPQMLNRGSTVGGLANAANAELQFVTSPISITDRKIREMGRTIENSVPPFFAQRGTTDALMDVVGAIPRAGGYIGQKLTEAGIGLAGGVLGHNLGTTPQGAMDIYREVPKLANTVGSIALAEPIVKGVGKTAPFVKQGLDATGQAIDARNIKMANKEFRKLAPPSKAPSMAMQAKKYDSRIAEAVPEIQKDIKSSGGKVIDKNSDVAPVEQMTDFVRNTKNRIWNEVTQKVDPIKNNVFDTKISADKTLNEIKGELTQFQSKDLSNIESYLKNYETPSTIGEVSREITRLNENVKSYEKLTNEKKAEVRRTDPMLDVELRLRDNLRKDMFDQIDASGITGVGELRKKYGAVAELHGNLLGNLEKNKGLDTKGNLFGVFQGTPIAYSLIMGAITKLATDNPMLLGVEGATAAAGMYAKQRSKPSPTSKRIVNRLR